MKTEWLVADVTPGVSPDRTEHATQEMILDVSLTNSCRFSDRGAILWCRNPLLGPDNFIQDHLVKIEWLFANVTVVESPDRGERDILEMILSIFWDFFANSGHFCGQRATL